MPVKAQLRPSSVCRTQMSYSSFAKPVTHPLVVTANARGYVQNKTSCLKPCWEKSIKGSHLRQPTTSWGFLSSLM